MKTLLTVYCLLCASFVSAQLELEDFTTTVFPALEEDFTEPPSTDPALPSARLDSRARLLTDAEDGGGLVFSRNPVVSPSLEFFENNRAAPATVPIPSNRILVEDNLGANNDWTPLAWPSTLKPAPTVSVQPLRSTRTRIVRPLPSVVAAPVRASTAGVPQLQRPPIVTFAPSDAFRTEASLGVVNSSPVSNVRLEPTPVLQPEVVESATSTSAVPAANPIDVSSASSPPVDQLSELSETLNDLKIQTTASAVSAAQGGQLNTSRNTDIISTNDTLSLTPSSLDRSTSTLAPTFTLTEAVVQLDSSNSSLNETEEKLNPNSSVTIAAVETTSSITTTAPVGAAAELEKPSESRSGASESFPTTPIPPAQNASLFESTTAANLPSNVATTAVVSEINATTLAVQPAILITSTTTEPIVKFETSHPSSTLQPFSVSTNLESEGSLPHAGGGDRSELLPRDDVIAGLDDLANAVDGDEVVATTVEPLFNNSVTSEVVTPLSATPSTGVTISSVTPTSSASVVPPEGTSATTTEKVEAAKEEIPVVATSTTESAPVASSTVSSTTDTTTARTTTAEHINTTSAHSAATAVATTTTNAATSDGNITTTEPSTTTPAVELASPAILVNLTTTVPTTAPETKTAATTTTTTAASVEASPRAETSTENPTSTIAPATVPPTTSTTTSTVYSTTLSTDETASTPSTEGSVSPTPGPGTNTDVIIAATVSVIVLLCVAVLLFLLILYRRKRSRAAQGTCQPARLDAYSLDNVSPSQTWQRGKIRSTLRASKRSYSNQAFDDPVAPSNLLTAAQLSLFMEKTLNGIENEFQQIPMPSSVHLEDLPPGTDNRNRYANVLPYPETRVRIRLLDPNAEDTEENYINANYIRGIKEEPRCYIACQAPLDSTVGDFWQMVWETQSRVIIQLTDLAENGISRCAEYLPPSEVLDCHRLYGDFQITLKSRELRENYVVSHVQLKHMEDNLVREVRHLWYSAWPTTGVPEDVKSVISLLQEARKGLSKENGGPVVVHCSPGTGRTGTALAIDISMRQLDVTRSIDVPRCVYKLRQDRTGCVQTKEQYIFIYKAVNHYASQLSNAALDSI